MARARKTVLGPFAESLPSRQFCFSWRLFKVAGRDILFLQITAVRKRIIGSMRI